ncbi:hypothetical protein CYMTET_30968, partial [Cymbomonas tetramitiformis]
MAAPPKIQLVDFNGMFNVDGFTDFVIESNMESWGLDYKVVAIMGPQSSGKSTLLNQVFGTSFTEMDAMKGRSQTTQGIWMARSPVVDDPLLVMDLEGNDGRERGEDDTAFEKQATLFAMASADILLVNMWSHDVGRETGSGKPLLKTVLEVNLKLFNQKRTVLLFVFRDRTKTPLEYLASTMSTDMQKIWESVPKPPQYVDSPISDFFDIR